MSEFKNHPQVIRRPAPAAPSAPEHGTSLDEHIKIIKSLNDVSGQLREWLAAGINQADITERINSAGYRLISKVTRGVNVSGQPRKINPSDVSSWCRKNGFRKINRTFGSSETKSPKPPRIVVEQDRETQHVNELFDCNLSGAAKAYFHELVIQSRYT